VLYGCCTGSCSGAPINNYLTAKTASLNFNFTNLRSGIKFYYFIGGVNNATYVASSTSIVNFKNINQPLRNRILPTGNPNIYQLVWSTANATSPYLKWGTSPGVYTHQVTASISNIYRHQMCAPPANSTGFRELGNINTANITGIDELNLYNQDIYYVFGDSELNTVSNEVKLHIPPKPGTQPPTRPTTVVLMGDLGVGVTDSSIGTEVFSEPCPPAINTTMSVTALVNQSAIDGIFLTGDLAYANGYLATWDFFLNMIAPMAGGTPFFTTVGNHESDSYNYDALYDNNASGGECSVPSLRLMPMPAPATLTSPWFSYEVGLFHFTAMSTEHNFTIGSPQYQFLEKDLSSVNRTKTPWLIFTGHRSMYVDSTQCCFWGSDVNVMSLLQANIEPLMHKYQVNLAFSGHFHNLERQSAIYQNKTVLASVPITVNNEIVHYYKNPKATVWMLTGSAGRGPSISKNNYTWSERYWNNVYGYAIMSAVNATTLSWKLIQSSDNKVIDNVLITQDFSDWSSTESNSSNSNDDNVPLIVGVTLGVFFFVVLLIVGLWYYFAVYAKKAPLSSQETKEATTNNNPMTAPKQEMV